MAQLDPSIILDTKPADIAGGVAKGFGMANLAMQTKETQQSYQDQQDARTAAQKNVQTNPDGSTSLNREGYLSQLYNTNPTKAMSEQTRLNQQDIQTSEAQLNLAHSRIGFGAQLMSGVTDQSSYDDAKQKMIAAGMGDSVAKMPPVFDKTYTAMAAQSGFTAQQRIENQAKQQGLKIQQQEADAKTLEAQSGAGNKKTQAMQQTMQLLESARGNPAASQAERDLYASNKLKSLVGGGNNVSPEMAQLAASEVAKIAQGGVPTTEELKGLKPSTIPSGLASLAEKVANRPVGADAQAFMKQYLDYADSVSGDAKKVIQDKYGRIIESKKRSLDSSDYQSLQDQYINRFNQPTTANAPTSDSQTKPAWAK